MQNQFKAVENPISEMMELNVKTFKKLQQIHPAKTPNQQQPQEVFEDNFNLIIKNTHELLDYWQNMFQIMDRWVNNSAKQFNKSYEISPDSYENLNKSVMQENQSSVSMRTKNKPAKRATQARSPRKKANAYMKTNSPIENTETHKTKQ